MIEDTICLPILAILAVFAVHDFHFLAVDIQLFFVFSTLTTRERKVLNIFEAILLLDNFMRIMDDWGFALNTFGQTAFRVHPWVYVDVKSI
jgi:hypothetical protein